MAKYLDSTGLTYLWGKITAAFQSKVSASGILKGDGSGGVTAAVSGTDYQAPLPSQTGNSGKYLTTNGSAMSWATISAGTPDIFWVTVTATTSGNTTTYSADKTFAQIEAAITADRIIIVKYDGYFYQLSTSTNYYHRFICSSYYDAAIQSSQLINPPFGYIKTLEVDDSDNWTYYMNEQADIFIVKAYDTLHSEIKEAYNAGKMIFCIDPTAEVHDANCNIYVPLARYKANANGSEEFIFSSVNKHIHGQGGPDFEIHSIIVDLNDTWTVSDDVIATIPSAPDGEKWYKAPYNIGTINNIIHDGTYFVAGTSTGVWFSSDGFSWTQTKIKQNCMIAYGNSKYVACLITGEDEGYLTVARIATLSSDGTWTTMVTNQRADEFDYWGGIEFCSGAFVAYTNYGTVAAYSVNVSGSSDWTSVNAFGENPVFAHTSTSTAVLSGTSPVYFSTTTDGVNWTQTTPSFGYWYSPNALIYLDPSAGGSGKSKYVAILGDNGGTTASAIFTSSTGATWTQSDYALPWDSAHWTALYDGEKAIIFSSLLGRMWTSENGSTWTEITNTEPLADGVSWNDFGNNHSTLYASNMYISGYAYSSATAPSLSNAASISYVQGAIDGLGVPKIYTGTCSTPSNTADKIVILDNGNDFSLTSGTILAINFAGENTATSPTLNVNNTGSVDVRCSSSFVDGAYFKWGRGVQFFVCEGSSTKRWALLGDSYNSEERILNILNRSERVTSSNTNYTTYMARGEALNSTDTNPTTNGCISWTYA